MTGFSRKRGRPKLENNGEDFGTEELRQKRLLGLTAEPIDLCLRRKFIKDEQHRAGLHFRWLYTLKYGLPTVQAVNTSFYSGGAMGENQNPEWQAERENEYNQAVDLLKINGSKSAVMDVCIFHHWPKFLIFSLQGVKPMRGTSARDELEALTRGLDCLRKLWS